MKKFIIASKSSPLARGVAGGTRRGVANSSSAAQKGCRVAPVGLVATSLCAIIVATAAYATGENIVTTKKYTDDTFQTKISTDLVSLGDDWIEDLPSLVSYDETSGLVGNKYGILDYNGSSNYVDDGWNLYQEDDETNLLIPTVGAVGRELASIWDSLPPPLPWTNTQTAAVNNYSTTFDGTTNNWPSDISGYMVTGLSLANGLALKQNKIPAGNVLVYDDDGDGVYDANDGDTQVPGLVAYDSTTGALNGTKIGIFDYGTSDDTGWVLSDFLGALGDNMVPTVGIVANELDNLEVRKQNKIPKSGYAGLNNVAPYNTNAASAQNKTSWLSPEVKGTGLVTRTATDGRVGERKIFESTDVANYHATALSQNEKDIQDISIPTVGAMMTALSNGTQKMTWSATQTAAVNNYSTTFDGTTNNWVATDSGKLVDGNVLANAVALKQNIIPAGIFQDVNDDLLPSVVTTTGTAGTVGQRFIMDQDSDRFATDYLLGNTQNFMDDIMHWSDNSEMDAGIPTVAVVSGALSAKQHKIPAHAANVADSVLTDSTTAGNVQKRTIYDGSTTYVAGTHASQIPTMGAVMAKMQTKIPAGNVFLWDDDEDGVYDAEDDIQVPGLVAYDPTTGALNGTKIGILDQETILDGEGNFLLYNDDNYDVEMDNFVPTVRAVANGLDYLYNNKQNKIPKSGYAWAGGGDTYNTNAANVSNSWLNAYVKGTGLVTRTATDGQIGERKIFESTDVTNYHAAALSQNEKDIQDISIPTVGAMMNAIQNGSSTLIPAGTAGNVVTYTGTAGVVGSNTVASAATYDQGALTNGSSIANVTLVETKQNKIAATTTNYTYDATNRPNADGSLVATTTTAGTVAERPIVNAATYDSTTGALTNGSAIPNITALDTRQKKKVCAGWQDTIPVADRTDANCWLWYFPD